MKLDRVGAACGLIAVILSAFGFALIGTAGLAFDPSVSDADITKAIAVVPPPQAVIGAALDTSGAFFMIVFAARLRSALRQAEGPNGWLSTVSLAGALLALAASLGDKAVYLVMPSRAGHGLDIKEARALIDIAGGSFVLFSAFAGVVFVGGAAVAILTRGGLPRWLGWLGVAVASVSLAGLFVPPDVGVGFGGFGLFIVWTVAASITLIVKPPAVPFTPA